MTHTSTLPSFLKFNYPDYTFKPDSRNDEGVSIVKGKIQSQGISFILRVNVTNFAPRLLYGRIPDLSLPLVKEDMFFQLPEIFDREGQQVTVLATEVNRTKLPEFVTFN